MSFFDFRLYIAFLISSNSSYSIINMNKHRKLKVGNADPNNIMTTHNANFSQLFIYINIYISNWKWPFKRWVRLTIGLLPTSTIFRYCQFSIVFPKLIIDWCKLIESLFLSQYTFNIINHYHLWEKAKYCCCCFFILNHTTLLVIVTWDAHFYKLNVNTKLNAHDTFLECS